MHRRALKALLAAYRRRWPQESVTVARFDAFVDSHPDCFHRSCRVGHVTGSAWLVDMAGDRVLLAHHRKLKRWLQSGGHSDGDPDTREPRPAIERAAVCLEPSPYHETQAAPHPDAAGATDHRPVLAQ